MNPSKLMLGALLTVAVGHLAAQAHTFNLLSNVKL